jgi:hypothetical protein
MDIVSIDSRNRIFQVTDLLSHALADNILSLDWTKLIWNRPAQQESWSRRNIDPSQCPDLEKVSEFIWQHLEVIEHACNVTFVGRYPGTTWWYDEPGFDVNIHTDGHLPATMQIFWIAPGTQFATQFYKSKNPVDVITKFEFIPNTGYIMLNMPNNDGSQPLQWHGMLNKVPENTFRVSSYTTFGAYENK